jgi:hypothetical protein
MDHDHDASGETPGFSEWSKWCYVPTLGLLVQHLILIDGPKPPKPWQLSPGSLSQALELGLSGVQSL